jgi:hypothetical protein
MEAITANSLGEGRVVFQTATGWVHDINGAELLEGKEAVAAALARAMTEAALNRVVEPYAIVVTRAAGRLVPARLREAIRAAGPTTGNSSASYQSLRDQAA